MRRNSWDLTCKRRTAQGGSISEPKTLTGQGNWTVKAGGSVVWLRIRRQGNVISSFLRRTTDAMWTELYRYEDVGGNYGSTVYVGPFSTYLALSDDAWDASLDANPYYSWRFRDMELQPFVGLRFILR